MSTCYLAGLGHELTCPVCSSTFLRRTEAWAYRLPNGTCVCSWGCLRKAEAQGPAYKCTPHGRMYRATKA